VPGRKSGPANMFDYNPYLVALHSPDLQYPGLNLDQLVALGLVEDGTAVGPVVAFDVHARRVWLGEKCPFKALCSQHFLEKLEVVNFLETKIAFKIVLQINPVNLFGFCYDLILNIPPSIATICYVMMVNAQELQRIKYMRFILHSIPTTYISSRVYS
jgi:hypothetical protein